MGEVQNSRLRRCLCELSLMMENDTSNSHPESINVEDNDTNVELASNEEETCSLPISAPSTPKSDKPSKITVVLCPVGGAPIMKQRKWEVDRTQTMGFISSFIRKKLALQKSDSLSFAPSLDQSVQNLFDCFGSDGKLVLSYCKTQ